MKKNRITKAICMICAAVLVLTAIPFHVFAADPALPWAGKDVLEMIPGEVISLDVNAYETVYLRFTPPETGDYTFLKTSSSPFLGGADEENEGIALFDSAGRILSKTEENEADQQILYHCSAGETYYFRGGAVWRYKQYEQYCDYFSDDNPLVLKMDFLVLSGGHDCSFNWQNSTVLNEGSCYELHLEYITCAECGIRRFLEPNFVHDYEEIVLEESTCTEYGEKKKICRNCGYYEYWMKDILGHIDSDFDGLCDDCGETINIVDLTENEDYKLSFTLNGQRVERMQLYFYFTPQMSASYGVSYLPDAFEISFYDPASKAFVEQNEDMPGWFDLEIRETVRHFGLCDGWGTLY